MAGAARTSVIVAVATIMLISLVASEKTGPSVEEYVKMKKYLRFINRPGVKSIQIGFGEFFDCVDIRKQPALDHPSLRNLTVQMKPSSVPEGINIETSDSTSMENGLPDGGCPVGTVPIRRIKMEDLVRAGSVANFMNKHGKGGSTFRSLKAADHQYAVESFQGGVYRGTQVAINVWNPQVKAGEIFSLSQLWIVNGPNDNLNTIEVGWQEYPGLYGDSTTRLFVYWTADSYRTTGCYNLRCPGFVQVSRSIVPEMRLSKISSYGRNQEDITLLVFWDEGMQNWWLGYRETTSSSFTFVGYWPGRLFNSLVRTANRIDWGGEVVGDTSGTYPEMGSGHFPSQGYSRAAYMKQIMYIDSSFTLRDIPTDVAKIVPRPDCYQLQDMGTGSADFRRYFFFGGPGGLCATAALEQQPESGTIKEVAAE